MRFFKKRELLKRLNTFVECIRWNCDVRDDETYAKFKNISFKASGGCNCTFETALGDRHLFVTKGCIIYKDDEKNLFTILFDKDLTVISDYMSAEEVWNALQEIHDYMVNECIQIIKKRVLNPDDEIENSENSSKHRYITNEFKEYVYALL